MKIFRERLNAFSHLSTFDVVTLVAALFLILLAILHRRLPWLNWVWRTYRNCVGPFAVSLVVGIFGFGLFGETSKVEPSRMMHAIHMLKLDSPTATSTIAEQCARGCAVLMWVILGIELNRRLLFGSLHAANLIGIRNHVIVCGLGEVGMRMVRDLAHARRKVVVIEQDVDHPLIDDAQELGAIVITGNALDDEMLKKARVRSAAEIFALTGGDTKNATLVSQVRKLTQSDRRNSSKKSWFRFLFQRRKPLRCFASISNIELADAVKSLKYEPPELSVSFVVPELLAATDLLRNQFLSDLPPDLGNRTIHFVIIGFKSQGQALVRMIADLLHLENEKRCRLTILYADEIDRTGFMSRFPAFCQESLPETNAWALPAEADHWRNLKIKAAYHLRMPKESPGLSFACNAGFEKLPASGVDDRIVEQIEQLLRRDDCLPFVAICQDDDATNLQTAQRLSEMLQGQVQLDPSHPWAVPKMTGKQEDAAQQDKEDLPPNIKSPTAAKCTKLLVRIVSGWQKMISLFAKKEKEQETVTLGMPLYIQLWEHDGLHEALRLQPAWAKEAWPICRKVPFGKAVNVLSYDAITGDDTLQLAYRIFAAYELFYSDSNKDWGEINWETLVEFDATLSSCDTDKLVTWNDWTSQDYSLQYSNVAAALHGAFKARLLNPKLTLRELRCPDKVSVSVEIDEDLFRKLGRVEHNRWNAEKLMGGWRFADEKDGESKHHRNGRRERPQLVANEHMSETLLEESDNEVFKDLMQYECFLRHYGIEYTLAEQLKQHAATMLKRSQEAAAAKKAAKEAEARLANVALKT